MLDKMPGLIWNRMLKDMTDQLHRNRRVEENTFNADRENDKLAIPPQMYHAIINNISVYSDQHDSKTNGKTIAHRPKKSKVWAALAASLILVLGVSANTFGSKDYVMSVVKVMKNNKLTVKVSRGVTRAPMESDTKDVDAIEDINKKLGIKQTVLGYLPRLMRYNNHTVDLEAKKASTLYKDEKENTITYTISVVDSSADDSQNAENSLVQEYILQVDNHDVPVRVLINKDTNKKNFIAKFTDNHVFYTLSGTVEKEEFDEIVKNLIF